MKAFARSMAVLLCAGLTSCGGGGTSVPAGPCTITAVVDSAATFVAPPNGTNGVPATIGSVSFIVSLPQLHHGLFTLTMMGVSTLAPGTTVAFEPYQTDASGKATVAIPVLTSGRVYVGGVSSGSFCGATTGKLGDFSVQ